MKAQVSFEFMVVIFAVVLITSVFGLIVAEKLKDVRLEQDSVLMNEMALTLRNEIEIAHSMEPGYVRYFTLPDYLGKDRYNVSVQNTSIIVSFRDNELFMAVEPVNGSVFPGSNIIRKQDAWVILNG